MELMIMINSFKCLTDKSLNCGGAAPSSHLW